MMDFEEKVRQTIDSYSMIDKNRESTAVIVGVSGGADSMSLLTALYSLKDEYSLSITAAHVNHGLRGAEAKRDEDFVVHYCEQIGVECRVLHADVPRLAAERGLSFEACGREVRYDFFKDLSLAKGSESIIATAHNGQDVVETILFNMCRGAGLHGLCSIPPVRPLDEGENSIPVIRPLIECTRGEIEAYLSSKGISFVTDSTNLDDMYARNNIRLNVLPLLEKVNGGAVKNILRLSDTLREDDRYLEEAASTFMSDIRVQRKDSFFEGLDCFDTKALAGAPYSIRSRAVSRILSEACGTVPEKKHIDDVCAVLEAGGRVQIPKRMYAVVSGGLLYIEKSAALHEKKNNDFKTEILDIDEFRKSDKLLLENALDYDKIKGSFNFRTRQVGDRFRPPHRNLSKSLKALFNERHIPVEKRSNLGILDCGGELLWIEGIGPASGYNITNNTKEVLYIYV